MRHRDWAGSLGLLLLAVNACAPEFVDRPSLVDRIRVIGVQSSPPEAAPGDSLSLHTFVADPTGVGLPAEAIKYAFCNHPKSLSDNSLVNEACFRDAASLQVVSAQTSLPLDACSVHGPDRVESESRPRDPDTSGGYYQPLRVGAGDLATFSQIRIRCALADAPASIRAAYNDRYVSNHNPEISAFDILYQGQPVEMNALQPATRYTLRVVWPVSTKERFVQYDQTARDLQERSEALRISWYATSGHFASDHTGRSEAEDDSFSDNEWISTTAAGVVHLWVVLRDSRGGLDAKHFQFQVL